jgi:hypothetical protein
MRLLQGAAAFAMMGPMGRPSTNDGVLAFAQSAMVGAQSMLVTRLDLVVPRATRGRESSGEHAGPSLYPTPSLYIIDLLLSSFYLKIE